ncbi:MAG: hypothetical protein M1829_004694 [Trizodia sp. TS-e1964]|nr:MAG: hypothetical protein M1829_004694 [Trizodia sp. TS-e1964]
MGSGTSKPSSEGSRHVFSSETPVQFSHGFIESLQNSPETDSTREKALELHIQSRVASELQRIQSHESQKFKELAEKISTEPLNPPASDSNESSNDHSEAPANRDSEVKAPDLDRQKVQQEINLLKKKLETRKRLVQLDEGVETAKKNVALCLKLNQDRPLDCWKEVDAFRKEVGRLERSFVERIVR